MANSLYVLPALLVALVTMAYQPPSVSSGPAPFRLCNETERPIQSRNIEVDVSNCDSDERCPLYIGTNHSFTVKFVPEVTMKSDKGIERYIIAKFPPVTKAPAGRAIEIPYGTASPANNNTFRMVNGQAVSEFGNRLQASEQYMHNAVFPVLASAPKTNLTVRYVIREKITGLGRRRSDWRSHPGTLFACVEIPVELKGVDD